MESVQFPSRSTPAITVYEALFFFVLLLFLLVVCIWPVPAWRIHHFSTWAPDATHSFPVHEHGTVIYLSPTLGRFYVSLPWLWCALLAMTVLTGFLTGKKARSQT
jgi:hypothetical protein